MTKAQVVHKLGPPSAMQWEDWPVADPAPGEVRLRHTAIGVNFADTYHRGGISHPWPVPEPPVPEPPEPLLHGGHTPPQSTPVSS